MSTCQFVSCLDLDAPGIFVWEKDRALVDLKRGKMIGYGHDNLSLTTGEEPRVFYVSEHLSPEERNRLTWDDVPALMFERIGLDETESQAPSE